MLRRQFLLALGMSMLTACATTPDGPPRGHFVHRELALEGRTYRYQVFVPLARQQQTGPLPIVLFLHGSGERGGDGYSQTESGLGPYLRDHATTFPALAVFPQVPEDEQWMGVNARMALATLDAASAEFGADPARTYLTGMSMGGYGAWEIALMQPKRFAALVPICGALHSPREDEDQLYVSEVAAARDRYATVAQRLRNVPVWMFHGAQDDLVPPGDDRRLYKAARLVGADMRYSEYPDGNHNAWDATYADPRMWEWMFGKRLRAAPAG